MNKSQYLRVPEIIEEIIKFYEENKLLYLWKYYWCQINCTLLLLIPISVIQNTLSKNKEDSSCVDVLVVYLTASTSII